MKSIIWNRFKKLNSISSRTSSCFIGQTERVFISRRFITHDPDIQNPNKDVEEQKKKIEEEIQRSLQGKTISTIPEFEGWDENLATSSEAIVKAERSQAEDITILKKETLEILEKEEQVVQDVSK